MFGFGIKERPAGVDSGPDYCGSCAALCCKDVVLDLTPLEADYLMNSGTNLRLANEAERSGFGRPARGRGVYRIVGACSMLEDNRCTSHETRPQACREYENGGAPCLSQRRAWQKANVVYVGMPTMPSLAVEPTFAPEVAA